MTSVQQQSTTTVTTTTSTTTDIITSSPSVLQAATGPPARPRSVPSRERAGLSHPHSVDAAVGSPLSQVSGVCRASPNKTEFGDLGVEHSSPRPVKASAGVRNVRNDAPAPAGNSREPDLNVALGGNTRAANNSAADLVDSSTLHSTQGTGTQGKTRGLDPGPEPSEQVVRPGQEAFDYPSASLAPDLADTSRMSTLHCPSSSTLATAQEGRNAVRSARPKKRNAARSGVEPQLNSLADCDFDVYVMSLWRDHLKETGRSCGKNSNYWKSWFAKLDLSLDSDVD